VVNVKRVIVIFAIAAMPLCSQAQQRDNPNMPVPTTADAQRVVQIIGTDKIKTQQFCELVSLEAQIEKAETQADKRKVDELSQKIVELGRKLGSEYFRVLTGLERLDPSSKEVKEITSALDALDELCEKK
jgi:hypothetical protein